MDALDRELAAALAVDPSPEFVARVRARIASEPTPVSWRMPRLMLAATAVGAVIVGAVMLTPRPQEPEAVQAFRPALVAAQAPGVVTEVVQPGRRHRERTAPAAIQVVSIDDMPSASIGAAVVDPIGTPVSQMALNVETLTGVHP